MTRQAVPLQLVVDSLRAEVLLPVLASDKAVDHVENLREAQPWYIRATVGFGALLSSLLLIGFVGDAGRA